MEVGDGSTKQVICRHVNLNLDELPDDYACVASRLTASLFGLSQEIFTMDVEAIFDGEEIEL